MTEGSFEGSFFTQETGAKRAVEAGATKGHERSRDSLEELLNLDSKVVSSSMKGGVFDDAVTEEDDGTVKVKEDGWKEINSAPDNSFTWTWGGRAAMATVLFKRNGEIRFCQISDWMKDKFGDLSGADYQRKALEEFGKIGLKCVYQSNRSLH